MTPRLSILCPALACRRGQWPILDDIWVQCKGKPAELLVLTDDGDISVGEKHNMLYRCARGAYICTVADDDAVTDDYVETLLGAIGETDVVTFDVGWGGAFGWPDSSCELRPLAPCRREIACRFLYPDWWQSEDRAYRTWLGAQGPSVLHVPRVLYHYNFRQSKPEYGGKMYPPQSAGMATRQAVAAHVVAQGRPTGVICHCGKPADLDAEPDEFGYRGLACREHA